MLTLEKYKTKASRFECPACGRKNVLARYVDESGNHLADEVGRCNRESKCGYHLPPKEYFAARGSSTWTPKPGTTKPQPKPVTLREIPIRFLEQSVANVEQNTFVRFLLSRYDREQVLAVCERYFLGHYEDDKGASTTFWRVDEAGHINTAKLIPYDAATGKRIKAEEASWLHAKLKWLRELPQDFDYRRCLFGQHLLHKNPATVAIVEAEKTAVIASLELPEYVWLACGGRNQLNSSTDDFRALGKRRVILFPDGDSFDCWSKLATDARAQGADVHVSDLLETELTAEQKAQGWDLADYLLASEPIATQMEVVAVASKPLVMPAIASVTAEPSNVWATCFVGHCNRCGDYLQPDGSCNLCKRPLPF